jgi:hypothetical protein
MCFRIPVVSSTSDVFDVPTKRGPSLLPHLGHTSAIAYIITSATAAFAIASVAI